MPPFRRVSAASALLGLAIVPWLAPRAQPAPQPVLLISVAASDPADVPLLRVVLQDVLQQRPVQLVVTTTARFEPREVLEPKPDVGQGAVLGRSWVDLTARPAPVIYFVDPAWQRVLVRRLPDSAGRSAEIAREAIGQVVLGAVEALLAGEAIGVPVDEAAPLVSGRAIQEPDAAAVAAVSPLKLHAAMLYEALAYSKTSALVHGPGVRAGAGRTLGTGDLVLGVAVSVHAHLPRQVDPDPVGMRLWGAGLRLLGSVERRLASRYRLRVHGGGGLDLTGVEPRGRGEAIRLAASQRLLVPVARLALETNVRLTRRLSLSLLLLADIDLSDTHYVVEDGMGDRVILRPFPLRPGLAIAVGIP